MLKVFLSYRGHIQTYRFIVDPKTLPNVRRTIHQSFDPGLALFEGALIRTPISRQDARRFEAAVSWLFWMLGFSPMFFGEYLTDAPDLLMVSEDGTIVIVEATTGMLQSDNKLANFAQRAEQVRASIAQHNIPAEVIPVLCTTAPRSLIAAHQDRAAELGIVIVDAEYMDGLVKRTMFVPDSDVVTREFQAILTSREQLRFARLNAIQ